MRAITGAAVTPDEPKILRNSEWSEKDDWSTETIPIPVSRAIVEHEGVLE